MVKLKDKQKVISGLARDKKDTGSPEVQVGILTAKISELTEHLKINKKDFAARRGLLQMVGKRKRLLKYVSQQDSKKYLELIKKLGIRR